MIYLAGPMGNRRQIDAIAKLLPFPVVSTWHTAEPPELPSPEYLADAAKRNHADLATAKLAAFVVHRGKPLETWVEFGAAITRGIPVLVFYPVGTLSALPISVRNVNHEPVTRCAQGETEWIAKWIAAWFSGFAVSHCKSPSCQRRDRPASRCCACRCARCVEADGHGVYAHPHPFVAPTPTTPASSDGWPPVAPIVQDGEA